jgi:hypothetical protein
MTDDRAQIAERYARFATTEAPGRSELYAAWAREVATDAAVQSILARIAPQRRQPPLVFAVARLLGAPEAPFPEFRSWLLAHADALVAECARRSVQTNEPLRCAALLPALSRIDGPVALLEVGASAGLCLYPDRYSYRYVDDAGDVVRALDPGDGVSPVVLTSHVRDARDVRGAGTVRRASDARAPGADGDPRPAPHDSCLSGLRLPEVVWRAGIDLNPLDPRDPDTAAWLTQLVWPGETGRAQRVRDAVAIAAADPPLLVAGDGADRIAELAASTPPEATLVVQTPGVLAHIPRAGRHRVIDAARAAGRWVTLDAPGLHDGWAAGRTPPAAADGFVVALDGAPLALADPLGGWLECLPGAAADSV